MSDPIPTPSVVPPHRLMSIRCIDHEGEHGRGVVAIHGARLCANCTHHARNCAEDWDEATDGPCLNGVGDYANEDGAVCDLHQTQAEFDAEVHCPGAPL